MNDIKFIETLKQKRNACDYSQSRLALELQISRQNLNEIENGKTKASKEMKHILLHYLDYCNCTQPFTLTIPLQKRAITYLCSCKRLVLFYRYDLCCQIMILPYSHSLSVQSVARNGYGYIRTMQRWNSCGL